MRYLNSADVNCADHTFLLFRLKNWRDRKREEDDDAAFPDEIDTPIDVSARTRFQRYRGLRSFRTSPWDPYENLPKDYARIFQFEDFKRTERAVKRRIEEDTAAIEVCHLCCSIVVSERLTVLNLHSLVQGSRCT